MGGGTCFWAVVMGAVDVKSCSKGSALQQSDAGSLRPPVG